MAEGRLVARAIITTPFLSISDTAELLNVPSGRVERLEELLSAKRSEKSPKNGRSVKSVAKSGRLTAKKRRK